VIIIVEFGSKVLLVANLYLRIGIEKRGDLILRLPVSWSSLFNRIKRKKAVELILR